MHHLSSLMVKCRDDHLRPPPETDPVKNKKRGTEKTMTEGTVMGFAGCSSAGNKPDEEIR